MTDIVAQKMESLIQRLEQVSGPDRELDEAIALAQGWYKDHGGYGHHDEWFPPKGTKWHEPPFRGSHSLGGYIVAPRYTSSIDAALTLVPKDKWWTVSGSPICATVGDVDCTIPPDRYQVSARTCAIALCIAALKARASGGGQ